MEGGVISYTSTISLHSLHFSILSLSVPNLSFLSLSS
jgi:hypothetical protein